jgi:hypothetical protein
MTYTAVQNANAKIIWDFWKSKGCDDDGCASWVADGDRETSLNPSALGDKGTAHGIAQYHQARISAIKAHTGIDMASAPLDQQCAGIYFEITSPLSPYRHVWPMFMAAQTLWSKNQILIHSFEQSGNQARDLEVQIPKALYWLKTFGAAS